METIFQYHSVPPISRSLRATLSLCYPMLYPPTFLPNEISRTSSTLNRISQNNVLLPVYHLIIPLFVTIIFPLPLSLSHCYSRFRFPISLAKEISLTSSTSRKIGRISTFLTISHLFFNIIILFILRSITKEIS